LFFDTVDARCKHEYMFSVEIVDGHTNKHTEYHDHIRLILRKEI